MLNDFFRVEVAFDVEEEGLHVLLSFDGDHGKLIVILTGGNCLFQPLMAVLEVCGTIFSPHFTYDLELIFSQKVKPTSEVIVDFLLGKCILKFLVVSDEPEGLRRDKVEAKLLQCEYHGNFLALVRQILLLRLVAGTIHVLCRVLASTSLLYENSVDNE